MSIRMVTLQIQPGKSEHVYTWFQDSLIPMIEHQEGFRGLQLFKDRTNDRFISVALWESDATMQAFDAAYLPKLADDLQPYLVEPPQIGLFEIALQAMAHEVPHPLGWSMADIGVRVNRPADSGFASTKKEEPRVQA